MGGSRFVISYTSGHPSKITESSGRFAKYTIGLRVYYSYRIISGYIVIHVLGEKRALISADSAFVFHNSHHLYFITILYHIGPLFKYF